jgi:xanthine dehydrogenase YagR molybdenum-binding subunit
MTKKPKDSLIGDRADRVDGRLKVMGGATYFAEYPLPNVTYGVLVGSTVARGTIKRLETKQAERSPGVLMVLSHLSLPNVPGYTSAKDEKAEPGKGPMKVFENNRINYNGQPIALVVADTLERATYAASLISAEYQSETPRTRLEDNLSRGLVPKAERVKDYQRGEVDAYKKAPVVVEQEYTLPTETHNPMELHGTLAHWETPQKVTVYAKTQGTKMYQQVVMKAFNLPEEGVHIRSPFVGGAFGMGLRAWPHEIAVLLAAKILGRPVKLVLGRDQMFTMVGHRPYTQQKIGLGATPDGKLVGLTHWANVQNATYEEFTEATTGMSKFMYECPNVTTRYRVIPLDMGTPIYMRGPGESTGAFALESALDELASKLKLDPIEMRLRNYPEQDPEENKPWSTNYVRECYKLGAEKIGWKNRVNDPKSTQEDGMLVGYGMATGTFSANRGKASAKASLKPDGTLLIQTAASDIGPGTSTVVAQIAADVMGMDIRNVRVELGDSLLPQAPSQGGSTTVSTVGSAVNDVCVALKQKLGELASTSSLKGVTVGQLQYEDGQVLSADRASKVDYATILKDNKLPVLELTKESSGGDEQKKFAMYAFSVHFVKVHVHPKTGVVRIKHAVAVADAGTIVNHKTASSQMIGGAVGGIGMALMEEVVMDHRYGRYANNNLADYHVPVNADIPEIDVLFVDKKDPNINPIGAKGLGEIALIGMAPAIANAVFNATGKRIRELPITPDKLLG